MSRSIFGNHVVSKNRTCLLGVFKAIERYDFTVKQLWHPTHR